MKLLHNNTKFTSRLAVLALTAMFLAASSATGREYHVAVKGDDRNEGTAASPFRNIQRAADIAQAGDTVTVHAGIYREWVNPPRGGDSNSRRIVYRAAPGEKVEIRGSEPVKGWKKVEGTVWKITLPNTFFGDYNPYTDPIYGDWFWNDRMLQHTGEVFLNGKSLWETDSLHKVVSPKINERLRDPDGQKYKWLCASDDVQTTIWANFHTFNPNRENVEISVRRTCFYPSQPGVNYITLSGFHISQAASQWAAPTAEQIGMVGTHWNKGWIIENNVISNAKCTGITLGKERSTGHNVWLDDMSIDGSLHYIEVTFRTLRNGWNRDNIGSHLVRNNEIYDCGQAGICGSMGAAFSTVENNHIHHIYTKRQYYGAEMGGIKFHAAIDTQIRGNRIHDCDRALWLDWMAQGTRVSRNLFYNNDSEDVYMEVDHGPTLLDNNIFASPVNIWSMSHGGAFVHNLFAGSVRVNQEKGRYTPYHLPHSTEIAGLSIILNGDDRYCNNLFIPAAPSEKRHYGFPVYSRDSYPSFAEGNAYYSVAQPKDDEQGDIVQPDFAPAFRLDDSGGEVYIRFSLQAFDNFATRIIGTETLGRAKFPKQAYEAPDGSPLTFNTDYAGVARSAHPAPGPFETASNGENRIKVW
jgi:hypothetical protein